MDQLEVELGLCCSNTYYSVSWHEFVSRGILFLAMHIRGFLSYAKFHDTLETLICWMVSGASDQLEVNLGLCCYNKYHSVSWYEFISREIQFISNVH